MEHSKSKIKKLGSKIRQEYKGFGEIQKETLELLHDYRISFKGPMAQIFRIVTKESRLIHSGSVRTYRIKRIESIRSKLVRERTMGILEMGDIAGCRIIVNDEKQIEQIVSVLENQLNIFDRRDYVKNPRSTGYKSYHLMIEPDTNDNFKRLVEIQIRTNEHHNWATLVEITDQLFKVKTKEGEKHKGLERFHFLLSKSLKELSLEEMEEIILIEKELEILSQNNRDYS